MPNAQLIRASREVRWLLPMLEKLANVVDEYIDWDGEPPYWNNETASMSLLVAAASRANYVALADYRRYKWNKINDVNGGCDLMIGKGNQYIEIEAKQTYVGPNSAAKTLGSRVDKALGDAKKLWWAKKGTRAGLLFAVFKMTKTQGKIFNLESSQTTLSSVKSSLVWSWCDRSYLKKVYQPGNGYCYPGFALILKYE
jgi:hypothetical protein